MKKDQRKCNTRILLPLVKHWISRHTNKYLLSSRETIQESREGERERERERERDRDRERKIIDAFNLRAQSSTSNPIETEISKLTQICFGAENVLPKDLLGCVFAYVCV